MTAPLVLALPLIEGETLPGYVSRSASLHNTTPRDFCSDLGMRWPFLCSGRDDQIERLAWLIDVTPSRLQDWITRKIAVGRYQVAKAFASTGVLRRTSVRLCPRCVIEAFDENGPSGIYQKLEWSVLCIERCDRHGCALITVPSTQYSHSTYDFVSRVMEHKEMVFEASQRTHILQPSAFENYVRRRLSHGAEKDWLQDLDLTYLHRASLSLGAALCGQTDGRLRDLDPKDMREFAGVGFARLIAGPEGYRSALEELLRTGSVDKPFYTSDLGPHYFWLREVFKDPELVTMVDIMRDHVFSVYPVPTDKQVFGKSPQKRELLTIEEARKRTGLGAVTLKLMLGFLEGIPKEEVLKRTEISAEETQRVCEFRAKLTTFAEVTKQLGIFPEQLKALQNLGVLTTLKLLSSRRYLFREEVAQLLTDVATLPSSLPGKSTAPLREFCRVRGIPLARVISMWKQGQLDGSLCATTGNGLHAIEVDWDAVCDSKAVEQERDLTLPEAARHLQINVGSIRSLRDNGFLREVQHQNPDTNRAKTYISWSSIQRFQSRYVTLGQMALRQKTAAIHLARRLDRENIPPIDCGERLVRVYDKRCVGWE